MINIVYCPDHTGGLVVSAGACELPATHTHGDGTPHVCKILLAIDEPYAPAGDTAAWHEALKATHGGLFDLAGSTPVGELKDAKDVRNGEVDERTDELIDTGNYTHDAQVFSSSPSARDKITGFAMNEMIGLATYPFTISTLAGESYSVADAAAINALCGAQLAASKVHFDSGKAIKDTVAAITNDVGQPDVPPNYHDLDAAIAAVKAVADSR